MRNCSSICYIPEGSRQMLENWKCKTCKISILFRLSTEDFFWFILTSQNQWKKFFASNALPLWNLLHNEIVFGFALSFEELSCLHRTLKLRIVMMFKAWKVLISFTNLDISFLLGYILSLTYFPISNKTFVLLSYVQWFDFFKDVKLKT